MLRLSDEGRMNTADGPIASDEEYMKQATADLTG